MSVETREERKKRQSREATKRYADKNRETVRRKTRDWFQRNRSYVGPGKLQLIEEILQLKAITPCADCKQTFPSECMDFDHVRGEKLGDVAHLMQSRKREIVFAEIEKCDLVCANCHRTRTKTRTGQDVI